MTPTEIQKLRRAARANPDVLLALSEDQQAAAAQAIVEYDDGQYANDSYLWAVEQVKTIDEASAQVLPFPDRMYLHDLFEAMDETQKLAIPKSRRMMVSWAVAIYIQHQIRYRSHVAAYVQSAVEGKAAYIVDARMKFVEDNLPVIYRKPYTCIRTSEGQVGKLTMSSTGSFVHALAQGADAFRAFTPTLVFSDEIEFQEKGHQSFVAMLPFAEKKCKIIIVSSSNGPQGVLAGFARDIGFARFT